MRINLGVQLGSVLRRSGWTMWQRILMLLPVFAVCGTCFAVAADETTEEEDYGAFVVLAGQTVHANYVCYDPPRHDKMWLAWNMDLDRIEALREQIDELQREKHTLELSLELQEFNRQKYELQLELCELKTPGFWKRNFGRCFWTGAVAGATVNEVVFQND